MKVTGSCDVIPFKITQWLTEAKKKSGNYNSKVAWAAAERSPAAGERKRDTGKASEAAMAVLRNIPRAEVDRSGTIWVNKQQAAKYNHTTNTWRRTSAWSCIENEKPWADLANEVTRA